MISAGPPAAPRPGEWPAEHPLTIVVPIHGQIDVTLRFLDSFERQSERCPLLFVDDRSPDDSVARLRARGQSVLVPAERLWFNGIVRLALAECRSEFLGILNNDLVLGRDFVRDVVGAFRRSGRDLLVPRTIEVDGELDLDLPRPYRVFDLCRQEGWCMLLRTAAVRALPPIPEELRLWYGDTWLFHHAWAAGLGVGAMHHVVVLHAGSTTIEATAVDAEVGGRPKRVHPQVEADKRAFAERYAWLRKKKPGAYRLLPKPLRRLLVPGS